LELPRSQRSEARARSSFSFALAIASVPREGFSSSFARPYYRDGARTIARFPPAAEEKEKRDTESNEQLVSSNLLGMCHSDGN